jgi:hypothetical protein
MATYGTNFEFRVPPYHGSRGARFSTDPAGTQVPIGGPIGVNTADAPTTDMGLQIVELLAAIPAKPVPGMHGIAIYEYAPAAFAGQDPFLTTYSDLNMVPIGKAVQMVSGASVKVVFRNTAASLFLNTRNYPAFTIVAGMGATPTLQVGSYLVPGAGESTDGFWTSTGATAANAWLVVTGVDAVRQEVEARMLF